MPDVSKRENTWEIKVINRVEMQQIVAGTEKQTRDVTQVDCSEIVTRSGTE